jgi:hypothetical protein
MSEFMLPDTILWLRQGLRCKARGKQSADDKIAPPHPITS